MASRRRVQLALLGTASALAALVTAVLVLASGDAGAPDCRSERIASQGAGHAERPAEGFLYNSSPPTSGLSAPEPLAWAAYDRPVSQFALLHNLLHGGVAVQYGAGVPRTQVRELLAWYRSDPTALVVAPLPELADSIVLTAWTRKAECGRFDREAFTRFRDESRFRAPERPPLSELEPGTSSSVVSVLDVAPRRVRGTATILFELARSANIALAIRSRSGQTVRQLSPSLIVVPGRRVSVRWDRRDDTGLLVPAGRYQAVLTLAGDDEAAATATFEVVR